MRTSRNRTLLVAALTGAAMTLPATMVGAGEGLDVRAVVPLERSTPTYEFTTGGMPCEDPAYGVAEEEGYGTEGEVVRDDAGLVVTPDDSTGLSGVFVVPDLEGGQYVFTLECGPDEQGLRLREFFEFRRLTVDKVVEGDVPADTAFTVHVDCAPPEGSNFEYGDISVDLGYGADGGSGHVIVYDTWSVANCTVTETEDGGAETVDVDPATATFAEGDYNARSTVTNTFPAAEPTPTPTPTPTVTEAETESATETETPSPTPTPTSDDVDDDVEDAAPAVPVPAQPTYTG